MKPKVEISIDIDLFNEIVFDDLYSFENVISIDEIEDNYIQYTTDTHTNPNNGSYVCSDRKIHLDRILYKCKFWLYQNGWFNSVRWMSSGVIEVSVFRDESTMYGVEKFYADTEYECILKSINEIYIQYHKKEGKL